MNDQFELYDLALVVEEIRGTVPVNMHVGDCVWRRSGKVAAAGRTGFLSVCVQAAIPLLPAKQRHNHPADWMETDALVTCPDPACGLIMRIERTGSRRLHHADVSVVEIKD